MNDFIYNAVGMEKRTVHMQALEDRGDLDPAENEMLLEWPLPINQVRDGWGRIQFSAYWRDTADKLRAQVFVTNPEEWVERTEAQGWSVRLVNAPTNDEIYRVVQRRKASA
jgi:hypothetical protein